MGKKKSIPRVWELCEPHPDVFSGELNLALFAASLHQVETGEASPDYTEPERFFEKTFMTKSLENLLEGVLGRLAGEKDKGAPVLQLQTPFGGGKTHTLVALYHAARHPGALPVNLKRELSKPVSIAVLDGVALSPQGRKVDGLELKTLWGELAYRLGGQALYELVREADEARTAPGSELLTKILRASAPALILMDEVLQYLVKVKGVAVGRGDLSEQTQAFLHELSVAVSGLSNCVLVVSLPASALEIAGSTPEEAQRLFDYSKKIFGRVERVETPVAQDEVFGVLRKRLFKSLPSDKEVHKVAMAFSEYYEQNPRSFTDEVRALAYRKRIEQAYPFHPELIDLLYQRWGPHPQFQRTRGALRLLALVIQRLQQEPSAYLIQPCHIDLSDRIIRSEVVKLLGSEFDTVVTSDVIDKGGALDKDLKGDYFKEKIARGLAGSIFLYSICAAAQDRGASPEELNIAVLRPGLNPALATETLSRLRDRLWYLVVKDRRYRFDSRPNLNKVLQDYYEASVADEQLEEGIRETLSEIIGRGGFRVCLWPRESRDIEDRPEPTLVIVHPDWSESEENKKKQLESLVQFCGAGYRVHKNELVFLLADQSELAAARTKARRQKALEAFKASAQFRSLDDEDKSDVNARLKDSQKGLEDALLRAYSIILRPDREGFKEVRAASKEALGAQTLAERVWQSLKDQGLLVEALAPEFIVQFVWSKDQDEVALKAVYQTFLSTPGLPLLADEGALNAVAHGVQAGKFGYAMRQSQSEPFERVSFNEELSLGLIDLETGWLIQPEKASQARLKHAEAVIAEREAPTTQSSAPTSKMGSPLPKRLTISTQTQMLYPLLKAADLLKQIPGQAQLAIESEGISPALRQELERLLKDYGVSYEFE